MTATLAHIRRHPIKSIGGEGLDRVTLTAARKGDWLEFRVNDTGIGMTPEQQEKLFQRFTQADVSTTRRFGGTGLGRALTKAFAEMMGGTIAVDSIEGEGTSFTLTLPADLRHPVAPASAGAEPGAEAGPADRVRALTEALDDVIATLRFRLQ